MDDIMVVTSVERSETVCVCYIIKYQPSSSSLMNLRSDRTLTWRDNFSERSVSGVMLSLLLLRFEEWYHCQYHLINCRTKWDCVCVALTSKLILFSWEMMTSMISLHPRQHSLYWRLEDRQDEYENDEDDIDNYDDYLEQEDEQSGQLW